MSSFYLTVFFLYLFEQAELGNAKAVYFHAKKKNANGEQAESSCLVYIRSFNMLWYTAVSSSEWLCFVKTKLFSCLSSPLGRGILSLDFDLSFSNPPDHTFELGF